MYLLLSEAVDTCVVVAMGPYSGKWNLPENVCFVPNPCYQVIYLVSPFWCDGG